jgi:uncharacterized membrane protein YgdD (TMEM256/DUF423 family)
MEVNGWVRLGAAVLALGVIAGAFGAHALDVTPERMDVWQTAARYHLVHGLGLCLVGVLRPVPVWTGRLFCAGILLFSGSLYTLVLTDTPWLGAITPLGGLSFIVGWAIIAAFPRKSGN